MNLNEAVNIIKNGIQTNDIKDAEYLKIIEAVFGKESF